LTVVFRCQLCEKYDPMGVHGDASGKTLYVTKLPASASAAAFTGSENMSLPGALQPSFAVSEQAFKGLKIYTSVCLTPPTVAACLVPPALAVAPRRAWVSV